VNGAGHPALTARILVVDAETDTRTLYRETFSGLGCDVAEASDGRDAIAKALVWEPMLVLTELRLPLINGFALCQILREDCTTAMVPILVVTTETRAEQVAQAQEAGADVVLAKPTPIGRIVDEAQRLLSRSRDVRERSTTVRDRAVAQVDRSTELPTRSNSERVSLTRSHKRFVTTMPPLPPPALKCPCCLHPLTYRQSHIGGVSKRHSEQWDYFSCGTCGGFQYRHRTRKLRRVF